MLCFNANSFNSSHPGAVYMCKYIYKSALGQIMACHLLPGHYLNHCWNIANWTLRKILQWNLNQNTKLFIHDNAFKMWSVKWRPFGPGLDLLTFQLKCCSHVYIYPKHSHQTCLQMVSYLTVYLFTPNLVKLLVRPPGFSRLCKQKCGNFIWISNW